MRNITKMAVVVLLAFATGLAGCGDTNKRPLRVAINAGPEGDAIKDVYKNYKGVAVQIVPFAYASLREQLTADLSHDEDRFDVIMIDDPWFPQMAPKLRKLGNVPSDLLNDIVDKSLALGKDPYATGNLKALPYVGNTQLLFVRADILRKEGLKNPQTWTWDNVIELARRLTSPTNHRYGYAIRGRSGAAVVTDFLPIYWSFGGRVTSIEAGRWTSKLDVKLFRQALETYKALEQASPPGAINFDWPEMTAAFTNGQAAMELNWPAAIPDLIDALGPYEKGRWALFLPPSGKPGSQGTSMIGNWLLGVPAGSKNPAEAEKFIVWLMEQQAREANEGRPPTRVSVFDALAKTKPYFTEVKDALRASTARDRTEKWSQIEEAVSRAVTAYLVHPENVDSILKSLQADLNHILQ
jgi:multiple sugar transport system substrate-binding protein